MRKIPDFNKPPPNHVSKDFKKLVAALDGEIPVKKAKNLLIATWNIKKFSSLTKKWLSKSGDSPRRDYAALQTITEIISRFDVVAIQEVMGDLRAIRNMIKMLGDDWGFLMTDITIGDAGGAERIAYVFDNSRVKPSGLACELVIPPEWEDTIKLETITNQFARTPYAVSFIRESATFILVSLHIDYGTIPQRTQELKAIAKWMYNWARKSKRWHHNLITLGDFNIDRKGDGMWEVFTEKGLKIPKQLEDLPRTIFASEEDPQSEKYYDQIAWFQKRKSRKLIDMTLNDGGSFDFVPHVYTQLSLTNKSLQHRVSDHYPLWCEFKI